MVQDNPKVTLYDDRNLRLFIDSEGQSALIRAFRRRLDTEPAGRR